MLQDQEGAGRRSNSRCLQSGLAHLPRSTFRLPCEEEYWRNCQGKNGKEEGDADLKEHTLSKWQRNCHWKPDQEEDNDARIRKLHLRDMKKTREQRIQVSSQRKDKKLHGWGRQIWSKVDSLLAPMRIWCKRQRLQHRLTMKKTTGEKQKGWSLSPIAFEPTKKNMLEARLIATRSRKEPREEIGDLVFWSQLAASMWAMTSKWGHWRASVSIGVMGNKGQHSKLPFGKKSPQIRG